MSTHDGKTFKPDAKIVVETDDGAHILISGKGHTPWASFEFETGSDEYGWINSVLGVGHVEVGHDVIHAEIFQVRSSSDDDRTSGEDDERDEL